MHIPKNWRLKNQRYQLQGACDTNGDMEFPPRPVVVQQRFVVRYDFSERFEDEAIHEAIAS